jgi:hypothetical protein
MIYAYAAMAVFIFAAGFGIAHKIDKGEIMQMERDIAQQKADASEMMAVSKTRIENATTAAIEANSQLEVSHVQAVSTINALHDQLSHYSMHTVSRTSCGNAMPASDSAGIAQEQARYDQLSADLERLVHQESNRADKVGEFTDECFKFVNSKCGISQ